MESENIPDQHTLVDFIDRGIRRLELQGVEAIDIFGRPFKENIPSWSQTISLKPLSSPNSNPRNFLSSRNNSPQKHRVVHSNKIENIETDFTNIECPFEHTSCSLKGLDKKQENNDCEIVTICNVCHYRYLLTSGILKARYSRQNTVKRQSKKSTGIYNREYELRLMKPNGQLNEIQFQIQGKEDSIKVRKGDYISVLQTLKNRQVDSVADTISVYDHSTKKSYKAGEPDTEAKNVASLASAAQGCIATIFIFIVCFIMLAFVGNFIKNVGDFFVILAALGLLVIPITAGIRHGKQTYDDEFKKHSIQVK